MDQTGGDPMVTVPFFSVVIPLYDKEHFVERAVRSVLMQDFTDFEIVVVDDGSTDEGPEIVSGIPDDRLRLVRKNHSGVSDTRNHGVEEARASVVAFLDADDEWEPGFLSTIFGLVQQFPEAGLYATSFRIVGKNGAQEVRCGAEFRDQIHPEIVREFFRASWKERMPVTTSCVCVMKDALGAIGGFPADVFSGEDQAVWARLALKSPVVISRRCEATYHEFGTENTTRHRYFGPSGHFDYLSLLEGESTIPLFDDLERWVEKKMYDRAMTALVHGNDRHEVKTVLRRVKSRYWWGRRILMRILLMLPFRSRMILFKCHQTIKTDPSTGDGAES